MSFKTAKIDDLPVKFNIVNSTLQEVINELIDSWDEQNRYPMVRKLKSEFGDMQHALKAFLVEVRLNILILDEKNKDIYKNYCLISFKLFNYPIDPKSVEKSLYTEFGDGALSFEETYFNADIKVAHDIGFFEACNYVFCYSMLLTYYYTMIDRIINTIPSATINDSDLVSFDEKKNTVTQKALVLYYLVKDNKLNLTKISQDTTKQAKILSFLFDASYENLRKALTGIQETSSGRLKVANNVDTVAKLFEGLGSEFDGVNNLINMDLESAMKK